jgi:hypothetical protein
MTRLRRLFPVALAITLTTAATPAAADEAAPSFLMCSTKIYNGCFYSQPGFQGQEFKTIIFVPGCFQIPDTRSYEVSAPRPTTLYSEPNCTGQSHEIPGFGLSFIFGFTARSYHYPPA